MANVCRKLAQVLQRCIKYLAPDHYYGDWPITNCQQIPILSVHSIIHLTFFTHLLITLLSTRYYTLSVTEFNFTQYPTKLKKPHTKKTPY